MLSLNEYFQKKSGGATKTEAKGATKEPAKGGKKGEP